MQFLEQIPVKASPIAYGIYNGNLEKIAVINGDKNK